MRYLLKKEKGRFFIERYTDPDLDKAEKYKQEVIGFPITKPAPDKIRNFELFTSLIQELKKQAVQDGWLDSLDLLIVNEREYLDTPTERILQIHEERLRRIEVMQIDLYDKITHRLIPEIKKQLAEKVNIIVEQQKRGVIKKKFVRDGSPLDDLFIEDKEAVKHEK